MARLPLLSSEQVCAALRRAGYEPTKASGSHQTWKKWTPDPTFVTVVVLSKKEIPRGTLKGVIALTDMDEDEFLKHVR